LISDKDIVIADNALNTPQDIGLSRESNFDETKDVDIHGVMMALGTSFRVENYGSGPNNANDCDVTNNGRGCIYLDGGLIQKSRGAVGTSSGTGFAKRYSYDHCAGRESAALLPHDRAFPGQPVPRARPGRIQPHAVLQVDYS
jgi:hypothetical protein